MYESINEMGVFENTYIKPQGDDFADRCVNLPLTVQVVRVLCHAVVQIRQDGPGGGTKHCGGTSTGRDVRHLVVCQNQSTATCRNNYIFITCMLVCFCLTFWRKEDVG